VFYAVDDTRVKLADGDPNDPGSDYINANHVTVCLRYTPSNYVSYFIV